MVFTINSASDSGSAPAARLQTLGAQLCAHDALWRANAFRQPRLSWEHDHPALSGALRALPLERARALHADPALAQDWLGRWLPVHEWCLPAQFPRHLIRTLHPWPHAIERDVPGRKWRQIEAFLAAVEDSGLPAVDWCGGKGYLARALSAQWGSRVVKVLERDAALVAGGTELARRAALPLELLVCDVLQTSVEAHLCAPVHALALHACGDLHERLLRLCVARGVAAVDCAPCCYHLCRAARYVPWSHAARTRDPGLDRADLRTAVQETVTAPAHARRQRERLQQWQLGFDLLQRELRGVDSYLALAPLPVAARVGRFAEFCQAVARRAALDLPGGIDFARFERGGAERFREVTALDLVRHSWRRALEGWLVLDRAAYLQENGYRVEVGEFCERRCSPRNLLISARRDA
jgi:hypothetical protein